VILSNADNQPWIKTMRGAGIEAVVPPSEVSEPKRTWVLQIALDSCVSKSLRVANKRVKLKLWCSNDVCSNDNAIQAKPEFFHHLERLDCLYDFPFVF
jgi:hypothetical protein